MKIKYQNLILILPLFLFMSISSGLWDFLNRTDESLKGMQEEAKSLSNSIAELAPRNLVSLINTSSINLTEEYIYKIKKLWQFEQIKELLVLDLNMKPLHSYTENTNNAFTWELSADDKSQLKNRKVLATEIVRTKNGPSLSSIAGLVDDYGNISGYVQVDIDATVYKSLVNSILLKNLFLVLLSLVIGFLVSSLISRTISKRLHQLTESAIKVAKGNYSTTVDAGTIQEVEDLSNTFNTMSSVLGDVLEKAQRTLIESEIFRENQVLNKTFRENIEVNTVAKTKPGSILNLYSPGGSNDSLTSTFQLGENQYGIFLKLEDNNNSMLENSFLLQNAHTYIEAMINKVDSLDLQPIKNSFSAFSSATVLQISSSAIKSIDLVTKKEQAYDAAEPFTVGDFSAEVQTLLANYLKEFPESDVEQLLSELKNLWPETSPGCALYFLPKLA